MPQLFGMLIANTTVANQPAWFAVAGTEQAADDVCEQKQVKDFSAEVECCKLSCKPQISEANNAVQFITKSECPLCSLDAVPSCGRVGGGRQSVPAMQA